MNKKNPRLGITGGFARRSLFLGNQPTLEEVSRLKKEILRKEFWTVGKGRAEKAFLQPEDDFNPAKKL
ncbi:hypothetical protein C2E25_01980 [Geothermobacter hydrogeniphilus]|uniref:Uncharacterized protein n=1 Tax=Geothermobacter hydrogeniphilus TaxID=1969733 RepID=A0A2K2HDH6_9BACT|nr:hypothetical protein C2E25_01980 [Geothermobacter hydrogeniphilus]